LSVIFSTPSKDFAMKKLLFPAAVLTLFALSAGVNAQGIVRGAREGANEGNRAAGPVGGVIGGAVGGAVGGIEGGVKGILGIPQSSGDGRRVRVLTVAQIMDSNDADIARLKTELKLTPDQEKNWSGFQDAVNSANQHGADRIEARNQRARTKPPMDVVEQLNAEAQFLSDRAADQRKTADAARPLFDSLDDRQKTRFFDAVAKMTSDRRLD
jgi:hypothetical protein